MRDCCSVSLRVQTCELAPRVTCTNVRCGMVYRGVGVEGEPLPCLVCMRRDPGVCPSWNPGGLHLSEGTVLRRDLCLPIRGLYN